MLWLQTTQSFVGTTTEDEWLIEEILHDARPHTDEMKVGSSSVSNFCFYFFLLS